MTISPDWVLGLIVVFLGGGGIAAWVVSRRQAESIYVATALDLVTAVRKELDLSRKDMEALKGRADQAEQNIVNLRSRLHELTIGVNLLIGQLVQAGLKPVWQPGPEHSE